ncbi:hypothetical protein F5Y10DRAFT_42371 [Nemania abortiva]|nr:hypothetical protein F5Y10DRAFT_42371 [Nemania abortiva]
MNAYQFGHCDAYIDWLLTHGADATRLYTWATFKGRLLAEPPVIPRHTVLHRLCRLYGHMGFFTEMLLPVVSSTKRNLMADGCACVCTDQARDTHRGCSPLSVLLNHLLQRCGSYSHTTSEILDFFGRVQEFAEDAIRCLTFRRLHIRHTCCISLSVSEWEENELPYDYGSDFEELRGEDSERIHLLENLMVEFTEKYRTCGLTLREFLFGPWMQRMRAIEREHKNDLSNFEKDKISAIGVRMVEDTNDSGNRSDWEDSDELEDSASVGDIEDEEDLENGKGDPEDLSLGGHVISDSISSSGHFITFSDGKCMNIARPEHWYAQFEIIANGGRSRFEGWRLRPLLGRFPGNRP